MNASISLCMIARDEEENLGKCLMSVKNVVDEIIVVDTGSRDKTVSIARSFGAVILFHEWKDDFSDPRNISLEHARGDWILILDADEVLEAESTNKIIELVRKEKVLGYQVLVELSPEWTENRSIRLFKNFPELRFKGIFHEKLTIPDQNYSEYVFSDIRIIHKPWCKEDMNRKMARNIDLLKKHVTFYPDDIYQILDLVRLYLETEEISEAEKLLERVFSLLSSIGHDERNYKLYYAHYYFYKLLLCSKQNIDSKEMLSLCVDAISIVPQCPLFLYETAKTHYRSGNYDKAVEYFQSCLALGESQDFDRSLMFPKDILGARSLAGLGYCFFKRRDYKESAHYFNRSFLIQKNETVRAMINVSNQMINKEDEEKHQSSNVS